MGLHLVRPQVPHVRASADWAAGPPTHWNRSMIGSHKSHKVIPQCHKILISISQKKILKSSLSANFFPKLPPSAMKNLIYPCHENSNLSHRAPTAPSSRGADGEGKRRDPTIGREENQAVGIQEKKNRTASFAATENFMPHLALLQKLNCVN